MGSLEERCICMKAGGGVGLTYGASDCTLQVVSNVIVREIRVLSPTIKGFTLHVYNPNLTFRPGQWLALFVSVCVCVCVCVCMCVCVCVCV